jgi:hypothetical protein
MRCGDQLARPTPWLGIEERVTAHASMAWLLILSVVLLRRVLLRRAQAQARVLRWQSV